MRDFLNDAAEYDIGWLIWACMSLEFAVLSAINYLRFDATQFGVGAAAILGAGGAMSWMRTK